MPIKSHSLMQHLKPRFLLLNVKIGPREQQRSQRPILIFLYEINASALLLQHFLSNRAANWCVMVVLH